MSGLIVRLQNVAEAFQIQDVMCVYRAIVKGWLERGVFIWRNGKECIWFSLVMRNRSDQLCRFESKFGAFKIILDLSLNGIRLTFHLCLLCTSDILP